MYIRPHINPFFPLPNCTAQGYVFLLSKWRSEFTHHQKLVLKLDERLFWMGIDSDSKWLMIWTIASILFLWGLWRFIKLLVHLFEDFQSDFRNKREELLQEHSEPSFYHSWITSIHSFFHTIVRSPKNLFMILGWIAIGVLLILVMKGLASLLVMIKDVFQFFISGGRH